MIKKEKYFAVFTYYYLPALLWMGLIFYLSSIPGLKSGASLSTEIVLRKIAHIFEYFILTLFFWRIFYYHLRFSLLRASLLAFLSCIAYAVSDEMHQFFIEERTGRFVDVLVDGIGVLTGVLIGSFFSKIKKDE
ncbi:MAG: VanZ family protein [Candidatus Moranbacteria bacterium]|nr:VanZ family protein [Candidatus Moranbacteria bacterium]